MQFPDSCFFGFFFELHLTAVLGNTRLVSSPRTEKKTSQKLNGRRAEEQNKEKGKKEKRKREIIVLNQLFPIVTSK